MNTIYPGWHNILSPFLVLFSNNIFHDKKKVPLMGIEPLPFHSKANILPKSHCCFWNLMGVSLSESKLILQLLLWHFQGISVIFVISTNSDTVTSFFYLPHGSFPSWYYYVLCYVFCFPFFNSSLLFLVVYRLNAWNASYQTREMANKWILWAKPFFDSPYINCNC